MLPNRPPQFSANTYHPREDKHKCSSRWFSCSRNFRFESSRKEACSALAFTPRLAVYSFAKTVDVAGTNAKRSLSLSLLFFVLLSLSLSLFFSLFFGIFLGFSFSVFFVFFCFFLLFFVFWFLFVFSTLVTNLILIAEKSSRFYLQESFTRVFGVFADEARMWRRCKRRKRKRSNTVEPF